MSAESPSSHNNQFIAGDWGTTNLRLYLCQYSSSGSRILQTRYGAGISQIDNDFENTLFDLIADWLDANANLPVLLSGMVGSTIGWQQAAYLSCPINVKQITQSCTTFNKRGVRISILSGLRTTNPLGLPDVMRGEELQLIGWIQSQTTPPKQQLFALPGTHNKWALSKDNQITTFLTALTGELFAVLRNHSVLISEPQSLKSNSEAFIQGVSTANKLSNAQLIHALFSTRAKQVLGGLTQDDSLSYLSGLIIGADVKGAISLFNNIEDIIIIGEATLSAHYQRAIKHFGLNSTRCEPASIALSGYDAVYQQMYVNS